MADITITITISEVFKLIARRTSITTETDPFYKANTTEEKQYSQLHGESDRITLDLVNEAAKEVLKCFVSRQGDITELAVPFVNDGTIITYTFAQGTPALRQSEAIVEKLTQNTRDAIVYFVMAALYKTDGNINKMQVMEAKSIELVNALTGDLYRLHD